MLKKILKAIGDQLLQVDWIKAEADAYKLIQEKKRDDQLFAKIMSAGQSVHTDVTPTIRPFGLGRGK